MNRLQGALVVAAIIATIAFAGSGQAHAAGLTGLTPKKPSQLLNVNNFIGAACTCEGDGFTIAGQIQADGTDGPFSIPTGQVFVVTGMTWFGSGAAGDSLFMSLCVDSNEVWFDTQVAGANGIVGRSLQLSPLVFKSGHTLCAGGSAGSETLLTGFLTKDQ